MRKHIAYSAILAFCSFAAAQSAKVGWSLGYYCGWDQGGLPPDKVDWKAFTHVSHFTLFPNNDGSLDLSIGQFTDATCTAAVAAAHQNGVKIVICIGGAGVKDRFTGATSPANIHTFVKNLLDFMRKYGYDGIDTDWEENYNDAQFLAWHKELRDSLNNITPRPSLTVAGAGYFASHCAIAYPYVDMINTMSYDVNIGGMPNEMQQFTSRNVPKRLLGVGIGIGSGGGMVDVDSNTAKLKVQYAISNGFGGIMQWAVRSGARNTEVFAMLEQYRPAVASVIFANGKLQVVNAPALLAQRNAITGAQELRYRVAPTASGAEALIDLNLYDARGAFAKSLFHGYRGPGEYAITVVGNGNGALPAGNYVATLSDGVTTHSAALPWTR